MTNKKRSSQQALKRIFSITSTTPSPVRPCPSLCNKFRNYRAIPNAVGTLADGMLPRLPLCSFRSPVSQTLELVCERRSDKNSSTTIFEATLDRHRSCHDACQGQDSPGRPSNHKHYAPRRCTTPKVQRHHCKPPPLGV
jgi:hypothetical protein